MDPHRIIAENTQGSGLLRDDSFLDVLHESQRWDTDEYWKIEWSLYAFCSGSLDLPNADLFRIFSYVMMTFGCHFDPNDGFEITNLDQGELYAYRERIQLTFEGYFRRSMPSSSMFDIVNPLLITQATSPIV